MSKKYLFVILISFMLFLQNVQAEEYKLDSYGNYSVKEAYCTYSYDIKSFNKTLTEKFKIIIKDEKIYNVEATMGKYNDYVYLNTLRYSNFFKDKKFTCPKTVDVNYIAMPTNGLKTGYHLESACDEESLGGQCTRANVILEETGLKYNSKDPNEPDTPVKQEQLACSYQKMTSTGNSTKAQAASQTHLDYKKSSGNLASCSEDLYITLDFDNKKIKSINIVDSCNDSTNGKCVKYRRVDLASNPDSSLGEDGSSGQCPDQVDASVIPKIDADIDLDFDTTKGCESYLGNPKDNVNKPPAYYLQFAFNLIKYAAIIMLIVLTVIDYAKAVASSNQDAIKKATMNTVKRLIIAAIIFLLPMLIEFLFKILGIYSSTTCGIK